MIGKAIAAAAIGAISGTKIIGATLSIAAKGPAAGGLFAAAQSAGYVTAGSFGASIQSAVMGGAAAGPARVACATVFSTVVTVGTWLL